MITLYIYILHYYPFWIVDVRITIQLAEGQDSVHGENNHLLESTLVRMANYFECQKIRVERDEQATTDVPNDVALERFQKFLPPKFNGKGEKKIAKRWIEAMTDIYDSMMYSEERKIAFEKFQQKLGGG